MEKHHQLVPLAAETIENAIVVLRGQKVLLDFTLAALYGVPVKVLNQSVRRNHSRFPDDFCMQLTREELASLKSRIVTSRSWGGSRKRPYAFTEHGVAMLSSVLRSPQAVAVNIEIMRAFVRLRGLLADQADLARKLDALERRYDAQFRQVFEAIRELMAPPRVPKKRVGYEVPPPPSGGSRRRASAQR